MRSFFALVAVVALRGSHIAAASPCHLYSSSSLSSASFTRNPTTSDISSGGSSFAVVSSTGIPYEALSSGMAASQTLSAEVTSTEALYSDATSTQASYLEATSSENSSTRQTTLPFRRPPVQSLETTSSQELPSETVLPQTLSAEDTSSQALYSETTTSQVFEAPSSEATSSETSPPILATATIESSTAATSAVSAASTAIANALVNGRFASSSSSLSSFSTDGFGLDTSGGYTGDGSTDTNCALATGGGTGTVTISQTLTGLETDSTYTIQFALFAEATDACTVTGTFGSVDFFSKYFDGVGSWDTYTRQATTSSSSAETLQISVTCSGDYWHAFIDSIFVSNEVTPANIGDATLAW